MSDLYRLYLVKEKDRPEFEYLHPSKTFLAGGQELVSGLLEGRRVIVEKEVSEEELPRIIEELNKRNKAVAQGAIFLTAELDKIVDDHSQPV